MSERTAAIIAAIGAALVAMILTFELSSENPLHALWRMVS